VVETVDGRKEDYVALPDGRVIGCLFSFLFKNLIHVREAQIYQPDRSRMVLRVIKGPGYDETDEESQLLHETRKRVGDEIQIDIEYVEELERTPAGKTRYVVSEVPIQWALD
jgi:phenylacetate-CoA ligase